MVEKHNRLRGFTLVEICIVVIIIAILVSFAIPRYNRMVLKTKMIKRLPVLDAIRKAELLYYSENMAYYRNTNWIEPGDANTALVEDTLKVEIPGIRDYEGQYSSFTTFEKFPDDGTSAWLSGDNRFDATNCPYRTYASQGLNAGGDACIIMCLDENLKVKRLCVKYQATPIATAPVDDLK
ncbi:MAG: prepilin-type N-terminal cleavage/methylation domain-containing protein [Candidatus Omnitrophota bacterium]